LKEYGYKGKVKTITTYNYDTLSFDVTNKIFDNRFWRNKIVYIFDTSGNFDTIFSYTQLPITIDTVYTFKTAYIYSQQTKIALRINGKNEITDTVKFLWLNDTTYQTTETAVSGQVKQLGYLFLNKSYRDKAGKYTGYDENSKIDYNEKYENLINDNGLLTKSFRTNLLTNTMTVVSYKYFDFDKFGNPTKIWLSNLFDKKVFRIIVRKFEYY
jgi:hypothetical protein